MAEVYRPKATDELEAGPTVKPVQGKNTKLGPQKDVSKAAKARYQKERQHLRHGSTS